MALEKYVKPCEMVLEVTHFKVDHLGMKSLRSSKGY